VAWEDIRCWAEMNVFLSARREGWLDAIRYFSDMSLCSMKAWSHWERMDAVWRRSPPRQFPTPQEWDSAWPRSLNFQMQIAQRSAPLT